MGVIDGEYLEKSENKSENNMSDVIFDSVEKLALDKFPVNIVKDIDGDSYDSNKENRSAFTEGAITMLIMILKQEKL
jgi:hypothetical protein